MKMPKISKQCEECGGSSPVACKSCTVCGADFYTSEKADSPGEDTESTPQRRSERVRREKPDYYDALKFGGGPSPRPKRILSEKIPYRSAKFKEEYGEAAATRGRPRKHGKTSIINWKKSRHNDDDDDEYREKKKKKKHHKENKHCSNIKEGSRDSMNEEDEMTTMEELPSEKILQCQVSLAEINRKLGVVMFQPQPV